MPAALKIAALVNAPRAAVLALRMIQPTAHGPAVSAAISALVRTVIGA